MVIRILDIVPGANTSDEGARVFAVLRKALSANGPVVASFDGIQTATSWDTVAQLASWTVAALQAPDVQQAMARQGLDPETSTPQALAARIKLERKIWAGVIKSAGIKAE